MMYVPKRIFVEDDKSREAQAYAEAEVQKLNKLLGDHGFPSVSRLERPTLITYIKARKLGLLEE